MKYQICLSGVVFKTKGNLKLEAHGGCYLKFRGGGCHLAVTSSVSIGEMIRDSAVRKKMWLSCTFKLYQTPRGTYLILFINNTILQPQNFHVCIVVVIIRL